MKKSVRIFIPIDKVFTEGENGVTSIEVNANNELHINLSDGFATYYNIPYIITKTK